MDKRRIIWTVLILLSLALAIGGTADQQAEAYAEKALKGALVTFAAARSLNGIISVVQSTEVGVGVTVSVGQILDPINDLVERFSAVMLLAASSLGLQNVLVNMSSWWGVTALLAAASVLVIAVLWMPGLRTHKVARVLPRILLVALCIRFIVPVLVIGTNLISDTFLAADQAEATAALEITSRDIAGLNEEPETPASAEPTLMDRLGSMLDESLEAVNVSDRLSRLKESAASATEHIVDLIVLFVLQTILLPLAFLWLLVQLLKGAAARWFQFEVRRPSTAR